MDKGAFNDSNLPSFCKYWDKIQDICIFAIQNVLNNLEAKKDITPIVKILNENYLRQVTTAHNHSHLDPYSKEIESYYALEQFAFNTIINTLQNVEFNQQSYLNKSLILKFSLPF